MSIIVHVPGTALIRVGTGASGALEDLGYSVNGVQIVMETYLLDVPGDENGGDHGPPIDIQKMGEKATVRIECNKYELNVANKLAPFHGDALGVPGAAGRLLFTGEGYYRLLIQGASGANYAYNFPRAVLSRRPREFNVGTKYQTLVMEFECHRDPATTYLMNAVTA